jgi:hypothetical protein
VGQSNYALPEKLESATQDILCAQEYEDQVHLAQLVTSHTHTHTHTHSDSSYLCSVQLQVTITSFTGYFCLV